MKNKKTENEKTLELLKKSEKKFRELSEELEQRIQERTRDLNESKQLLEKTLYSLHDAVFILDAKTVEILECNPAATEIFGYSKEEMIGHTTAFLHVNENYLEEFRRNLFPAIEKNGFLKNFEFAMKRKDGNLFFTEHGVMPIYDENENQIAWVSVVSDITERKKSEQKLKESEQNYLKAFNTSSMYKDIFAHDINNILQNIQTSIELSELYLENPDKLKDINKLYQVIKEQINRGSKLVSNVRKLSQIEESEIPLKSMDLCSILNDSLQSIRSGFQNRDLNIHVDSFSKKISVQANDLLIDVFENILTNGIRHNNNPKVEISIKVSKEQITEAKYIKMEFKDNGVGITEEQKKTIFQKRTNKYKSGKGMGLGLSLVKKIIDNYKGFILVEDRIEGDHTKGSNFILLIPQAD
ncbi:MAG: nitrogen regulation protein NR(II) [Promethearchaeota archaeon]